MKRRDDEWTQKWRSLPVDRRRRIARAVYRGEAVADSRDAQLAIELSDQRLRALQTTRTGWFSKWTSWRHLLVFASVGVISALLTHSLLIAGVVLLAAIDLAGLRLFLRRVERHAAQARQKNEQIVRQL